MAKEFDIICLAVARATFKGHSEWSETSCMARWRILFAIYVFDMYRSILYHFQIPRYSICGRKLRLLTPT